LSEFAFVQCGTGTPIYVSAPICIGEPTWIGDATSPQCDLHRRDAVPFNARRLRSVATLPSRSNLGAILPIHDVRYHARALMTHAHSGLAVSRRMRKTFSLRTSIPTGGARRDRTDDLLLAKQALSQLSYGPESRAARLRQGFGGQPSFSPGLPAEAAQQRRLVGLGRLELPTSRLSSARSNQLSYKPVSEISNQKSVIRRDAHPDCRFLITDL
jgi:hypothetical protein